MPVTESVPLMSPPPPSSVERTTPPGEPSSRPSSGTGTDEEEDANVGERSPMLGKWAERAPEDDEDEDDGDAHGEEEGEDALLRLDAGGDDDDDEADDGLGSNAGSVSGGGLSGQWESSWGEEGFISSASASSPGGWGGDHHLTRGQRRKVYGGGRHGVQGGGLGAGEVAGLLLAGTLGPTPLLLPHAAALLGLPLFLPLLFLTAVLSWFAYLVLGVEARYVGARSWPSLTSAVFPHRLKTHRLGEFLASCLVLFVSGARGVVGVVAASEVVVDLIYPAGGRRSSERVTGVVIIAALWILVPLVVMPFVRPSNLRRRRLSGSSPASTLSRLPSYITFSFWPIALLILGVRLKTLNALPSSAPSQPPLAAPTRREAMGFSIWGGISILVFSLSAHQDTFKYLTSLARPPSTASRATRSPAVGTSSATTDSSAADREGRRNQWPLATALGMGGSTLTQMGWGLVGYLGIDSGGREGNLFASDKLPRGDPWLFVVRALVLVAIVVGLEGSLDTAYGRARKALVLVFGTGANAPQPGSERRNSKAKYVRPGATSNELRTGGDWRSVLARVVVWALVLLVSVATTVGGAEGEGLVSVAEIGGCVGSSLLGFFVPALFFIALFHLRRPRSIFVSDPSAPAFAADTLLMRKEREVQRRLSGRRIYQDIIVFGGLLPFGTVVVLRGCIALAANDP